MLFHRKKVSAIDRRLEKLHKEMSRVSRDLKGVSRASGPLTYIQSRPAPSVGQEAPPAPVSTESLPWERAGGIGAEPPEGDLFAHAAQAGLDSKPKPADYFSGLSSKGKTASSSVLSRPIDGLRSGREKFAHYFMAGHFQNLRPLRQESRILRNKAILMLIAVAALLVWLLYFLKSH